MPEAAAIAAMTTENVKVDKLVKEFLMAQTLKILPQTPFGDAVGQYVEKDDKHAMEQFVVDSLALQVQGMLDMEHNSEEEDLDPIMEQLRKNQEEAFASGARKRPKRQGKLRPRPPMWDSDVDGEWEDAVGAYEEEDDDEPARNGSDDNGSMISAMPPGKRAPAKKAPAKKALAKKAPAKTPARGRKKVVDPEPSDDEDMDDDVVMFDEPPPPAKSQPKRAVAAKGRQTQLNFSQPSKTQVSVELSDDEISDDDAFEPVQSFSRRR